MTDDIKVDIDETNTNPEQELMDRHEYLVVRREADGAPIHKGLTPGSEDNPFIYFCGYNDCFCLRNGKQHLIIDNPDKYFADEARFIHKIHNL